MKARILLFLAAIFILPRPSHAIVDLNQDGWSDLWQAMYGSGYVANADDDGDGRTNWEEHVEGTDPMDNLSKKGDLITSNLGKGKWMFSWPTVIGKSYQIEVSFDGTTWADAGAPVTGTGERVDRTLNTFTTFLGTGPRLARYTELPDEPLLTPVKNAVKKKVAPSEEITLPSVEAPQSSPNLEHFGQHIRGWLIPPADGSYTFWISGNRITEFSLSSNTTAGRKKVRAFSAESTAFRDWNDFPTQKSVPIALKAGKAYYLEVYQHETTGSDHVSLFWTGPGLSPDKEIIDGAYVTNTTETLGRKLAKQTPTWRLTVADRDTDGDGLTDHEERIVGLDPFNSRSVARKLDMETVTAMSTATNVVTVGAEIARGYEAEQKPARFTFFRSGNFNPFTVHFTVEGTAQVGQDYAPLSGVVEFGVGQTSATVELTPENDGVFEPAETVTARVSPDAAYEVGTPNTATVTIDDAADVVYVATLRSEDPNIGGYGSAGLKVVGNKAWGDFSLTFGHLTSEPTSVEIVVFQSNGAAVPVLVLPLVQVSLQQWLFEPAGGLTREQILAALEQGSLGVRIGTAQIPAGEISGRFIRNWGWKNMPIPTTPDKALTKARSDGEAARFLNQATFGATPAEIRQVKKVGYPSWLAAQFAKRPTYHLPYVKTRRTELLARSEGNDDGYHRPRQEAWWQASIAAPDQLRQRMAFALSQILVISDVGMLEGSHEGVTNYYDLLVKHAFGNFRTLLEEVTLSPMMGQYLSMARNQKPNPNTGSEPDENYAREIMQLFSIGLTMVNADGSLALDANGLPVPTYTQSDIVGLAHVFTGWGSAYDVKNPPENLSNFFRFEPIDPIKRMVSYPAFHDTRTKKIVGGVVIPANLEGPAELKIALDTIFQHPNVGPFIGRRLIQRFVTSNPSRGYVYRVASAFNNNGHGKRGDLKATLRAVLMDPEARNPVFADHASQGKLREPLLRVSGLLRAFRPAPPLAPNPRYFVDVSNTMSYQSPVQSPTVFNFFQPGYLPPGTLATAGLFGPEFQITQETSAVGMSNHVHSIVHNGIGTGERNAADESVSVRLELTPYIALLERTENTAAVNQSDLIDSFNALLLGGRMSSGLAQSIRNAWASLPANFGDNSDRQRDRVRLALYIIAASPEFSVQR
jgi:uncharacterized protein (DUF1800 family)